MRRFQQLLIAASPGRQPWQPIPDAAIGVVAAQCEPGDVDDIVAARDELAAEKSTLPEWDGDSRDDISRAQALFARLLLALPQGLAAARSRALAEVAEETRAWVQLAAGSRKRRNRFALILPDNAA